MILVDSDVLIAHLRGHPPARQWLRQARIEDNVLAISPVSVAEVTGGMRSDERGDVARLLEAFDCLPVSREIGDRAGAFRRRYRHSHNGISIPDYLIAATAAVEGCQLATLNVKHFPMFEDLSAPFV